MAVDFTHPDFKFHQRQLDVQILCNRRLRENVRDAREMYADISNSLYKRKKIITAKVINTSSPFVIFSFILFKIFDLVLLDGPRSAVGRRSWVRYPVWPYTFVSPSADSRGAVVGYWRKYVHEALVYRLGGLSLPRKSVVRLTDRPDMTLDVYRGRKTTTQQRLSAFRNPVLDLWRYNFVKKVHVPILVNET